MGLDMWLDKAKKIKGKNFADIVKMEHKYNNEELSKAEEEIFYNNCFECGEHFHYKSLFQEVVYWRKEKSPS